MKLAVVSDIHGNLPALQAVVADIARQGVDQVVNLGDILSGPLLVRQTAEFLAGRGWPTIAGNHERQLLRTLAKRARAPEGATSDGYAATRVEAAHVEWLRSLPPRLWLGDGVLLVHGTPHSDLDYWLETVTPDFGRHGSSGLRPATSGEIQERLARDAEAARASMVLCGHTHVPRIAQCGDTLVVNPGSVGLQAFDDGRPHYHQAQNGSPHARYAIVERGAAGWTARLCALPYDWQAMADLAGRNGFAGWAYALATGRMPPGGPTIAA